MEILKLQESLKEMQLVAAAIKEIPVPIEDTEKIECLTSEVDHLKMMLKVKEKEISKLNISVQEMQTEVSEVKALHDELENTKKAIIEDTEKIASLTSQVDKLKMEHQMIDLDFWLKSTSFSDRVLRIEIVSTKNTALRPQENDIEVKSFKVNSLLLAASSPFFDKFFKNEMKESQEKEAMIRVCASDEVAFMDILKFIYTNTISAAPTDEVAFLLGRLIVAYKFEVVSCMLYCVELLKKIPIMSVESAISYLELPASVSLGELLQPLILAAKEYLVTYFSDLSESQVEALFLKIEAPTSKDTTTTNFIREPIRMMHIEGNPQPCCVVYLYLGKDECEKLQEHKTREPNSKIISPKFVLGGREFYLLAKYRSTKQANAFAVFLYIKVGESESCTVKLEFAIMKKASKKFHKIGGGTKVYSQQPNSWGFTNLLGISWGEFMSKDSEYFTNGILQLQTRITIINPST